MDTGLTNRVALVAGRPVMRIMPHPKPPWPAGWRVV